MTKNFEKVATKKNVHPKSKPIRKAFAPKTQSNSIQFLVFIQLWNTLQAMMLHISN
jgi:hypothetical protein